MMGLTTTPLFGAIMIITSFSIICNAQMNDPSLILFRNCKYDKIFQFGDSLSDTGNIVLQDANGPSGRPPYGFSYFKQPTGRCSNGLLMIDYIGTNVNLLLLYKFLYVIDHYTCNFYVPSLINL